MARVRHVNTKWNTIVQAGALFTEARLGIRKAISDVIQSLDKAGIDPTNPDTMMDSKQNQAVVADKLEKLAYDLEDYCNTIRKSSKMFASLKSMRLNSMRDSFGESALRNPRRTTSTRFVF